MEGFHANAKFGAERGKAGARPQTELRLGAVDGGGGWPKAEPGQLLRAAEAFLDRTKNVFNLVNNYETSNYTKCTKSLLVQFFQIISTSILLNLNKTGGWFAFFLSCQ